MLPKLSLSEIKVGMKVDVDQLSEIYDVLIMVQTEEVASTKGIIRFIGKEPCNESQAVYAEGKPVSPIFNDSIELEEDIDFDE